MLPILRLLLVLVLAIWVWRWLRAFLQAGTLLWLMLPGGDQSRRRGLYRITVSTEEYPHAPGDLQPFNIYRPLSRTTGPAVVIYHGATSYGENHAVLDTLARALAKVGCLVFVPRLPKLKEVIIDSSSVRSMSTFYEFVTHYQGVLPGRITVVGTSFAGGLLLRARLEPAMREIAPRAVLTYGSYCDLETALKFVLTGRTTDDGREVVVEPDPWGQIIFFYNYLDHLPGDFDREAVREVLVHYVYDRLDEGAAAREALPVAEQRMADLMLNPGNPETLKLFERVLDNVRPLLIEDSPSHFYHRIDFPVWVLHGRSDVAVPYTEALALKRLLPRQVRLFISNLYGHKELSLGRGIWHSLKSGLGMLLFMGRFLRAVEGRG